MSLKTKLMMVIAGAAAIALVLVLTRKSEPEGVIRAGFNSEFLTRPDGYPGLKKFYGFEFAAEPVHLEPGLMYRAVADGAVDVICGFATDGRIPAYGLEVLEDDKGFFPPYYAAPLVRAQTLKDHPEIGRVLDELAGRIPDKTMQAMNYAVDEKGEKSYDVARRWLISQGLVSREPPARDHSGATITIGGKAFTEQEILGQIMAILIEEKTDLKVERKLMLGGTMICFNALKAGDLDLYAEYTGTALVNILKQEVVADPDKAYRLVRDAFKKDYGLIWLDPFGFNNTYTLTMRKDQAQKLHIRTISDLARFVKAQKEARSGK